ncbi:MAG: response regulator [Spirochaetales bacterium]|nr:response regulator [Spirochaetales bacterium]
MRFFKRFTTKLILLFITTLLLSLLTLALLSHHILMNIIDESQEALYREKLEIILNELERQERTLQSTGLPDAYRHDIQEMTLESIADTYYNLDLGDIYPFITNYNFDMILHPNISFMGLNREEKAMMDRLVTGERGTFYTGFRGDQKWYIYQVFEPWDWIVSFTVSVENKYKDAISYRRIMITLIFFWVSLTGVGMTFILVGFTRPILFLTETARNIAAGNLDDTFELKQGDEIGSLAESFREMQTAVNDKIGELSREIGERLRVEEELSHARNLISAIVDSMPSVIIAVDPGGNITQWNGRAEKNYHSPASEVLGRPVREILPWIGDVLEGAREAWERDEVIYSVRRESELAEGTVYEDVEVYSMTAHGQEGLVIRIDNVTDEILLEQQIAQSKKMDAIGQLAGGVAHDFNNMLAGISSAASLIEMTGASEDREAMEYVSMILEASDRAAELTGKLLSFGRRQAVPFAVFHFHEAVQAALALLERTIDKKINISFDPMDEPDAISGSFTAVQNGIMNLVINASHAMPEGGTVKLATSPVVLSEEDCQAYPFELIPGSYVRLDVKDAGVGIAPEYLDKIFEPFFTTKETGKGTGLGLASVYGMIQNHKGAISVDSVPGEGTEFYLFFPLSEEEVKGGLNKEGPLSDNETKGTILLVDDEQVVRYSMKSYLEKKGYRVVAASSGQEALDILGLRHDEIDLVLTDMVMPDLNGKEVFEGVKKLNKECPVLIISGYTQDKNLEQLKADGLDGFIRKPFKFEELNRVIRENIRKIPRE